MLPDSATFARIRTRAYDFKEAGRPMEYELFVPSKCPTPLIVTLHCLSAVAHDMIVMSTSRSSQKSADTS